MTDRNDMNRMSPDEYAEFKKQEKAEVYDLLSDATQKLLSGSRLREYADKQAKLFGFSVSNVLLIMEQAPEASWVRSYDDWKADGVTVMKGETGIKTLGSYRFQKQDGTMGMGSKVVKMFDVKQTSLKDFDIGSPGYSKVPDAIMNVYPAAVEVPELPDGELAVYDPGDKLIRVKAGLDPAARVFAVAREQTVYQLADFQAISREDVMPQAELAAYIVTKHYGLEAPEIDFDRISGSYLGKEENDISSKLYLVRFACVRIDEKVRESIELDRSNKSKEDREAR